MTISNEAVEAAAKAVYEDTFAPLKWERETVAYKADLRSSARAALDAAAPYIRAEALEAAADAWREYLPAVAGYGVVQPVPVWLERRADWLHARPMAERGDDARL